MPSVSTFTLLHLFCAALAFASSPTAVAGPAHAEPETSGRLPHALVEASGLASSRRAPDLLWSHNDRGSGPILYALTTTGELRGRVHVAGIASTDWEDLASFTIDGRAWLLIADVGDNHLQRVPSFLHLLPEPDPADLRPDRETRVPQPLSLPVRYADGPQDVEAVAVDPIRRQILLISKRSSPVRVYRLPLVLDGRRVHELPVAEQIGEIAALPAPTFWQMLRPTPSGILRGLPTSLDISADGRRAVLLTYGELLLYARHGDEDWITAFARPPLSLGAHRLPQAEAAAFGSDPDTVFVTSEGRQPPLLLYRLPTQRSPK